MTTSRTPSLTPRPTPSISMIFEVRAGAQSRTPSAEPTRCREHRSHQVPGGGRALISGLCPSPCLQGAAARGLRLLPSHQPVAPAGAGRDLCHVALRLHELPHWRLPHPARPGPGRPLRWASPAWREAPSTPSCACLCPARPPAHLSACRPSVCTGVILAPAKVVSRGGNPWGAVLYSWGLVQVSLPPQAALTLSPSGYTPGTGEGWACMRGDVPKAAGCVGV